MYPAFHATHVQHFTICKNAFQTDTPDLCVFQLVTEATHMYNMIVPEIMTFKPRVFVEFEYPRDDVVGQFFVQDGIVKAICEGFRPMRPIARGGQQPVEEPAFALPAGCPKHDDVIVPVFRCPFSGDSTPPPDQGTAAPLAGAPPQELRDDAPLLSSDSENEHTRPPPPVGATEAAPEPAADRTGQDNCVRGSRPPCSRT